MTPHRSAAALLTACCLAVGVHAQQADPPPPQAQPPSIQPLRKPPPNRQPEGVHANPSPQGGTAPTLGMGAAQPQIQVPLKRPTPPTAPPPPAAVGRAPVAPPGASAIATGSNAARCEALLDAGQRAKCRDDLAHEGTPSLRRP